MSALSHLADGREDGEEEDRSRRRKTESADKLSLPPPKPGPQERMSLEFKKCYLQEKV